GNEARVMELLNESTKHLDQAITLAPKMLEARFNRALCFEQLGLPEEAKKAWQEYLQIDPNSKWADEARRHIEKIQIQNTPPRDRSQVLSDYLDAFGRRDEGRAWEIVSQTKELVTGSMIQPQLVSELFTSHEM